MPIMISVKVMSHLKLTAVLGEINIIQIPQYLALNYSFLPLNITLTVLLKLGLPRSQQVHLITRGDNKLQDKQYPSANFINCNKPVVTFYIKNKHGYNTE